MSYLSPGRPKKYKYNQISMIPNKPGIYRIRDVDNGFKYIGLSNQVRRRVREHKKSGKFERTDVIEYLGCKLGTTPEELRDAEKSQIERHKPYANKTHGGEGPNPKYFETGTLNNTLSENTQDIDVAITEERFDEIAAVIKLRGIIIRILLVAVILGLFIFLKWNVDFQRNLIQWINNFILPKMDKIIVMLPFHGK